MLESEYTIGSLGKAAGVNVETVRYYHRRGLLPMPARNYGKVRRYGPDSLARLHFIRRAQRLGFTLEEVEALLKLNDGQSCTAARAMAERKLHDVEARLKDLRAMQKQLSRLVALCDTARGKVACPLIQALAM